MLLRRRNSLLLLFGARRLTGGLGLRCGKRICFRDSAAWTGAMNFRRIERLFIDDPPHGRRKSFNAGIFRFRRRGGRARFSAFFGRSCGGWRFL